MNPQKICMSLGTILLCLCLCCCSQKEYREDLPCETLAKNICDQLPLENGYAVFGNEHLTVLFDSQISPKDYAMFYSVDSSDINEIGVFRANNETKAQEIKKLAQSYLDEMRENDRAFIASYAPEELTKLDSAEVRRFGTYVILCICPPEEIENCFNSVEEHLRSPS